LFDDGQRWSDIEINLDKSVLVDGRSLVAVLDPEQARTLIREISTPVPPCHCSEVISPRTWSMGRFDHLPLGWSLIMRQAVINKVVDLIDLLPEKCMAFAWRKVAVIGPLPDKKKITPPSSKAALARVRGFLKVKLASGKQV